MTYKDILIYLDDSAACAKRIEAAIALARSHDAHLTGLALDSGISMATYMEVHVPEEILATMRGRERDRAEKIAADFRGTIERAGLNSDCHVISTSDITAAKTVAEMARYSDLVILGQVDERENEPLGGAKLPQDVMLAAGRPVLMVPYIGAGATLGERILVAWTPGRESARAVADALPLLKKAKDVTVLTVNPVVGRGAHGERPGADIGRHLARHGVKVIVDRVTTDQVRVADAILAYAADNAIDMIVMGAYGRSRLREVVLGGVTHELLQHMPVPLLMSH
ncbi:universal stress protein [Pelagibius sp. Alg239-R121]|uniref:universal stress protein n=1 Tax=Pelagibius sp. Alg239-R121 TaxID=2993448 RepID=UPI0024A614F3|nr:universal stress protein [Pelagibius sp. Alg239-R121]